MGEGQIFFNFEKIVLPSLSPPLSHSLSFSPTLSLSTPSPLSHSISHHFLVVLIIGPASRVRPGVIGEAKADLLTNIPHAF